MGYTSVKDRSGAVEAATALARRPQLDDDERQDRGERLAAEMPLLVDLVMAEAGVAEPQVCARALIQAAGDTARAVSLVRAWAATLPRMGRCRVGVDEIAAHRRITPGFREPSGGQYLGASSDYESRLIDLADSEQHANRGPAMGEDPEPMPERFPRALTGLEAEALVAPASPPATAVDRTRQPTATRSVDRGPFLQLLARAETGAMTAMAYSGQRGLAGRGDPTLVELRSGTLPIWVVHPRTGGAVRVGEVAVTTAEVALFRLHDSDTKEGQEADGRFTLGFGATIGTLERRAIAAAMLDANCTRAGDSPNGVAEDREFLTEVLDGQEASGFVEHLKLPHFVTFTSDLDRVRGGGGGEK